jgi:hypothetical protein
LNGVLTDLNARFVKMPIMKNSDISILKKKEGRAALMSVKNVRGILKQSIPRQ